MDSITLSLPKSRNVRGCMIKRMPLGAYLQAIQTIKDFPKDIAARMIPEGDLGTLLEQLKHVDRNLMIDLLLKAMAIVPEQMVTLIARLTGIPEKKLMTDAAIGADGLAEILDAWLEVNGAENFLRAASHAGQTIKTLAATLKHGYNG